MAVAEKKKQLPEFQKLYKEKSNKASKVIFKNLPVNAGEKPSSKRRKGKNNFSARPITEELDPQNVSHPKPPNYTDYFHNDEPFDVIFTRDHPQASQYTTCDVAFPRRMPIVQAFYREKSVNLPLIAKEGILTDFGPGTCPL